jgi:MFS family permease
MVVLGVGMGLVMPILTLALQDSFPKSELGVVTSSSQFFRSIGGTFGMTVLGAIMNHQSSKLLTHDLEPVLSKMPDQSGMVADMTAKIHSDPQSLYSMLLSPEVLAKLPKEFIDAVSPILKSSMVTALHSVFWLGFAFVLLGAVMTLFIGKIKLTERKKGEKRMQEAAVH